MGSMSNMGQGLCAVGVVAIIMAGCDRREQQTGAIAGGGADSALECPNHNVMLRSGDTTITVVPVAGVITNIPEFHDCQRLLSEQNPDRYGPLAGIWVSYRLDALLDSMARLNERAIKPSRGGVLGGFEPGVQPWTIVPGVSRSAVLLAQIYLWDGNYRPLGMWRGWNCLYFYPDAALSGLGAVMVPVGDVRNCPDFVDTAELKGLAATGTPQRRLFVATTGPADLPRGAFPPVGRWDWDGHEQYIGLGCGRSWCEVTPKPDYASSAAYRLSAGTEPEGRRRVFEVKGWYDEQRLALTQTNMGGVPATFHGVAIPDTTLDLINDVSGFEGQWVSAAWATVGLRGEDVHPKYEQRFNFKPGDVRDPRRPDNLSHVFMCQGPVALCFPKASKTTPPNTCPTGPGWWARIDPPTMAGAPSGPSMYRCIKRVSHSSLAGVPHIPGTARWFWLKTDETLWMRCAEGCCTLN